MVTVNRDPRAIVCDLDGTLTVSKMRMDDEMARLLSSMLERVPVSITTGGALTQCLSQVISAFPSNTKLERLSLYPTSGSACYVRRHDSWHEEYKFQFSDEERRRVRAALDDVLEKTGMHEPEHEVWGQRIEDRGSQITFSALGQRAPPEIKRTWDPDRKKRTPLVALLEGRLHGFSIRANAYTSIDITKEGVNKAYGVKHFAAQLNVPVTDMLYIGDALFPGGNDEVVISTGIQTHAVTSPEDTKLLFQSLM